MSPSPFWLPDPGRMSFWLTRGMMVREMRFQSEFSEKGITGLRIKEVLSPESWALISVS